MKFTLAILFALLATPTAVLIKFDLEDITAYNYLEKIGIPLAEEIRKAEQSNFAGGSALEPIPYQAGLLIQLGREQAVCGGSLIKDNRVLTAARCWWDGVNQAAAITVVLGSKKLFSGGTRINTSQVVTHPNYNPTLIRADIAIIHFPTGVDLSSTIAIIALPTGNQLNENYAEETAVAFGYGRTSDDGQNSDNGSLKRVVLSVISNVICTLAYPLLIQSSDLCTSGVTGIGTCSGVAGVPLVVQRNDNPLLMGVSSFGSLFGCQSALPAVFTRISSYVDFINQNL